MTVTELREKLRSVMYECEEDAPITEVIGEFKRDYRKLKDVAVDKNGSVVLFFSNE